MDGWMDLYPGNKPSGVRWLGGIWMGLSNYPYKYRYICVCVCVWGGGVDGEIDRTQILMAGGRKRDTGIDEVDFSSLPPPPSPPTPTAATPAQTTPVPHRIASYRVVS